MTSNAQLRRRKGSRVGPRTRAEAAIMIADGVPKAQVARELGIARETLRQFGHGPGADLFQTWIEIAKGRIRAGVPHSRIVDELLETAEAPSEEVDPAEAWEATLRAVDWLAGCCQLWNAELGRERFEVDPRRLLDLAARHVGENSPGPDCGARRSITKAVLNAVILVTGSTIEDPDSEHNRGAFFPVKGKTR